MAELIPFITSILGPAKWAWSKISGEASSGEGDHIEKSKVKKSRRMMSSNCCIRIEKSESLSIQEVIEQLQKNGYAGSPGSPASVTENIKTTDDITDREVVITEDILVL
jgi:hypothetical protein